MELSDAEKSKYKFREIRVEEKGSDADMDQSDIHRNLVETHAYEGDSNRNQTDQGERIRQKNRFTHPSHRRKKERRFGWAFFLASMFIGLGVTTVSSEPIALFLGMGIGFLFFVDPIYDKMMDIINRL